jgi:hypothetical protein
MVLVALLGAAIFGASPVLGADTPLLGTWRGGDRASEAVYGRLVVTPGFVTWSGSRANPGCRVRYRLVAREETDRYPDALPGLDAVAEGETAPRYAVFRLALQRRACTRGRSALQFAVPAAVPERAELITYDRRGQPVSWGHLTR